MISHAEAAALLAFDRKVSYASLETLQIPVTDEAPFPAHEQDDLLHPRLADMIEARHELVKLVALIGGECFEREW